MTVAPKILIVRLGSLGDIIHTVPALAAIRGAMPSVSIHWLVDVRQQEVLDLVQGVDCIHAVRASASGWLAVAGALRRERFDAALDFQGLLKSAALARMSGASRVIGFTKDALREPFAATLYTTTVPSGDARHVIDKNLALLRGLNILQPAGRTFNFVRRPSAALQRVRNQAGERFAILNPGAAWLNKRWPPERFGAVADALRVRHAMSSVVIWGPGEHELADAVVAASNGAAFAAPSTSIADLFALSGAAALMVSGDTGPLHIAAACGTPIVGIYGPTDPARNGPFAPADVCVSRFAACGCHHLRRCVRERWCLGEVSVQEVAGAVDRRLAGAGAR